MPHLGKEVAATNSTTLVERPPLIVHVIYHLGVGGLENGLVNLINNIPPERYRHAIVCLKGYSDFSHRIRRAGVEIIALNKREGRDPGHYVQLFKTLRRLKPDIVHTRGLGTMEGQIVAALARVSKRIHGEHGRDIFDLHGTNRKYNLLRRAIRPFVGHFISVSKDLENWLIDTIGVAPNRVRQIYNGVDSVRFHPRSGPREDIGPPGFFAEGAIVIGSVGRMAELKDFPSLVKAFLQLRENKPAMREQLRLLIVGDGVSRQACLDVLKRAGADNVAWLPGERTDIPELMRAMDLFVLPSLGEGISNTILEAMASGLPVIATKVGGNAELVREDITGKLVNPGQPDELEEAISTYCKKPEMLAAHGKAARQIIESDFSMAAMTNSYLEVYDRVFSMKGRE